MSNNTILLPLNYKLIKYILSRLQELSNAMKKNKSQYTAKNNDVGEFIALSHSIINSLSNIEEIDIRTLYNLELVLKRLGSDHLLNNDLRYSSATTYNEIKEISEALEIERVLELNNTDPNTARTLLLNNKYKLNDLVFYDSIDEENDKEITFIQRNIISNIASEISKIEQNSIKRMLDQSNQRLEDLREVQDGSLQNFNNAVQDNIDNISGKIESEVKKFESRREDMDQLLEQVGLAKDAEVTINQANKEEKRADDFRRYGIVFLYASIIVLVFMFSEYIGMNTLWGGTAKTLSDLTLEAFIIRFMTVTLISSPAIYMLKESASHRAKENLYRQRGTQLLTIRGYLSDLPDAQRTEVKKQLASNFFSFHNGKSDTSNVPDFVKNMNEVIKLAQAIKTPTEKSDKELQAK